MTTTDEKTVITKPGVYPDLTADQYHADPVPGGSLSSSGARRLLPPSCPALYRWEQDTPQPPKAEFELGHAAHKLVLGTGPELAVIDVNDWRTKAAQQKRREARERGAVPLKRSEHEQVQAMASALAAHPVASALFGEGLGEPEQSLFWRDPQAGIWRRARLDWLPSPRPGRMVIPDYKTAAAVDEDSIAKAVENHGYHQQAAWYLDGARALRLAEDAAFVFVFQAKDPPYLVHVVELDSLALRIGAAKNRRAIDTYRECRETGRWPGFADREITSIPLPAWAERRDTEEYL